MQTETTSRKQHQTITREREGAIELTKEGDGATKELWVDKPLALEDEKPNAEAGKASKVDKSTTGTVTKTQIAENAQKAQEAKKKKEAQASDPIEKAKRFLQKAPVSIRDLNSALSEAQTQAVK